MRLATGVIATVIAGCAGTPTAPSPAPITVASQPAAAQMAASPASAPSVSATPANAPPVSAPSANAAGASGAAAQPATDADVQRLTHAKKLGLTVVTIKGEVVYCRTERKTGSHLATETNCLTEKQLDDLHEQTSRDLENFRRSQLPRPAN